MKVLVVEDEKSAAKRIISLLHEVDPRMEVLQVLDTIKKTVEWYLDNHAWCSHVKDGSYSGERLGVKVEAV